MERKFESELAGQIARRHRNPLKGRMNVLLAALVSCVVMVAAAAAVLSMQASASLGGPTEYVSVFSNEDYLINLDGTVAYKEYADGEVVDDTFLVKRNSELKWTEFDTPGLSTVDYTKVVYSVNVKLRDISSFADGVGGMVVADLAVAGFVQYSPWISSTNVCVNGVEVSASAGITLGTLPYMTTSFDAATGTLSAQVILPTDITYNNDDVVSIFVMFKTVEVDLVISGSEIGFPDYQVTTEG
ncbi:MAG: hypothetical protein AB1793_05975 [Candidatus Thermoplasmatota archaeon]